MTVALVQTDLVWENPQENRNRLEKKINQISQAVDMIILPEMFTTGFSMNPKTIAEPMNRISAQWLQNIARNKKCAVVGSLAIAENGVFYNRLFFVFPNGGMETYNKRHLFSLAGENQHYQKGNKRLIVNYNGWKICPLVCYDLRFPVFSRNTENFDLLLYVANFPQPRIMAWDILLQARAVENMCYVAGVNRIGTDNNGMLYNGHSAVYDELGNPIIAPFEEEMIKIVTLDKEKMLKNRNKFGFLNDIDTFELKINAFEKQ